MAQLCCVQTRTLTSLFAIFLEIWIPVYDGRNTKPNQPSWFSMDQWALSREIICSLLPCLHQEVHLLLKQVVLFFLATFWMLGETPSPLCTPSCSLFLLLRMQAWQGSASARSILHSFGTQTKCYVLTGLCTAEKENSLKWVQIHGVDWFFCVCSSKKTPFSSSLNLQSPCKISGIKPFHISRLFTLPGHNLGLSLCLTTSSALVHPLSLFHGASSSGCIWS